MVVTITRTEVKEAVNPETATRIALIVEYDGTNYSGSQLQANQPTIQAELEKALKNLTGEKVRIAAASRTDSGVHAHGQVVSFKTITKLPIEAFVHGLNHYLPDDIAVRSAYKTALSFDARRMAIHRTYTYSIFNSSIRSPLTARFTHLVAGDFDINAMNSASQLLVGTHDFASFASDIGDEAGKSTVRNIYHADVVRKGEMIIFTIVANAFVRHQIRNTIGALVQVGLGKMSKVEFGHLLEVKQPGLVGPALPACGLCLEQVSYPCAVEEMI
jgi:tRNA pseudouridine38-40 synthase